MGPLLDCLRALGGSAKPREECLILLEEVWKAFDVDEYCLSRMSILTFGKDGGQRGE
jgi:hypothetical protein